MAKVIVQPLIEALSELVSQVSAIIVANKATNKAPPQELPMCVAGIQKSAGTLVQVARSLANDEYEDFPAIQEEIGFGARDVETSAVHLNEATKTLFGGKEDERAGAWDALGEAVRIMAQNTAILLHIVYGAEIKKIFALSNYTEGKLKDLLNGIQKTPVGLYESNPQLFVNKVQAAMEDVQKLAQGLQQKAAEEDSAYAKKELEDTAKALLVMVEPFVSHANELLAKPKDIKAKEAVVKDLQNLVKTAERVGAPKPKKESAAISSFVPELMECISNMESIDLATPAGQKEAQRMQTVLHDIAKARKLNDMGPHTAMLNQIVEVQKDLDQIEALIKNPDAKPLLDSDPFDLADHDGQNLLNIIRKLQPDENGGRDGLLADAEALNALIHNELLPLAKNVRAEDKQAQQKALEKLEAGKKLLDDVVAGMDLNAEQTSQVKAAEKVNSVAIKLNAMVGSKKQNKQDIFSAAKDLTDMLGEMSALLGLAQQGAGSGDGAGGALQTQLNISSSLVTPSQPSPKPKPGSAKAMMKKVTPGGTSYKGPAQQKNLAAPNRDSVNSGFVSIGVGAEELKTISLPASTKGANLLPDTDPIITGVRSLGEQLSALSKAATSNDHATLLRTGKNIHEQMKNYSAELRKRAAACKDPKIAHDLITLSSQLKNWSVQLKILTAVRASSGGGRDADHAMVNMAKLIENGLKGAPAAVLRAMLA